MNINLNGIFTTEPRSNKLQRDRFTGPKMGIHTTVLASTTINTTPRSNRIEKRIIDTSPHKILDAPGMMDDYYLNLLDWSSTNIVSIGLSESVYCYDPVTKSAEEIF